MGNNSFRLEPEAAQQCVDECNKLIDALDIQVRATNRLKFLSGFGELDSARQLQAGFARKFIGTPESLRERLLQFIDVITRMRDNFAAGGEAFATTEAANTQAILTAAAPPA